MILDLGGEMFGWREAVVGLIVAVALYMLFVFWRMRRLSGQERSGQMAPQAEPPAVAEIPPVPGEEGEATEPAETPGAWNEAPAQLARSSVAEGLEAEVLLLRDEVDALRGELAALRRDLHAEIAHMRAAQTVSPLYNDAMQMANAGHSASAIAERCGISRAEADLVVALVHGQRS